jgi:cation:H+ antiporter
MLTAVSFLAAFQLWDGVVGPGDAVVLLLAFAALMVWTIRRGIRDRDDALGLEMASEIEHRHGTMKGEIVQVAVGLGILVVSSRILVWSAVELARTLGVSDLVIGLTVVALGTSLPELASSVAAALRDEPDIALGNILGSNFFNTLFVVGTAAAVRPLDAAPEILVRDMPVMLVLTVSLFLIGYGFRGPGRVNRVEGGVLVTAWLAYVVWMARESVG